MCNLSLMFVCLGNNSYFCSVKTLKRKKMQDRIIGDGSYLIDGDEWKEFEMEL